MPHFFDVKKGGHHTALGIQRYGHIDVKTDDRVHNASDEVASRLVIGHEIVVLEEFLLSVG